MTERDPGALGATIPENYEHFFVPAIGRPLAQDLVREAELQEGERVLDVGCGTGVVARLAAELVGRQGSVTGLDVNPGMLAVARSVTPPAAGVAWLEASAETIPLPDESRDVVLCQLSLQFVPDRSAALREMHRVLRPGGRLLLNLPGPAGPLFASLADAMREHVGERAAGFVHAVFALHDEAEIAALLEGAGFDDVAVQVETRELRLPGARDFLWQYVGSTPLAAIVAEAGPEARAALERDVLARWSPFADAGGLSYRQRVVVASARRAE